MANTQPPPNIKKTPTVQLQKNLLEINLWQHSYDAVWEKAVRCPCTANSERNDPLLDCQNCLGLGWLFINPISTKVLISSLNKQSKYSEWSEELIGTVNMSFNDDDDENYGNKIALMDRITIEDNYSVFSENKEVKVSDLVQKFIFCSYKIQEVEAVFVFVNSSTKLTKLTAAEYAISEDNPYVLKLTFTPPVGFNNSVTVRYKHKLAYHIIDIQNDARRTTEINSLGQEIQERLPIHAIARKAHQEMSVPDYDGSGIIDNSF